MKVGWSAAASSWVIAVRVFAGAFVGVLGQSAVVEGGVEWEIGRGVEGPPDGAGDSRAEKTVHGEPEVGSLLVGDRAPALGEITWVRGVGDGKGSGGGGEVAADGLHAFATGTVYIVEFWATWCAPCVATMPHLSELQREHGKDKFQVIAITAEDARNTIEQVRKLVDSMGEKIAYPVGFDSSGRTLGAYMTAAAVSTIPCTFLIDRAGRIAWVGVTTEVDGPLKAVLDGTWDAAAFAPKFREQTAKTAPAIRVQRALAMKDGPGLIRATHDYFEATPDDPIQALSIAVCLIHPKRAMMDATHDNGLLDLAIEMLEKAQGLEGYRNSMTFSLLARAHSLRGNAEAAVAAQKKAVEVSREDAERERMRARLAEYEAGLAGADVAKPSAAKPKLEKRTSEGK